MSVGLLSYWWCPVVALFSISCFPVHCEFIGQIRLCVCCNIVNLRIHFYQFKKKMTVLLALPLFRHNLAEHYQYSLKKSITYSLSPQSVWLSFINRFMYRVRQKKNNPLEKILYLSNGSTNLSQTFRLYIRVFAQHILQISLKQLTWFKRYSSLNFKVYLFK